MERHFKSLGLLLKGVEKVKKTYKITLKFHSAFHIDSGKRDNYYIDATVLKKGNVPYLPGSTIKGKVRDNFCLIRELYEKHKEQDCNCEACRLFGQGGYQPSRVVFDDLTGESITTIRKHNSIDRYLKIANDQSLFSQEAVEPTIFTGMMEVYFNEDNAYLEPDLLTSIRMIENIGNSKSRGLGFVSTTVEVQS